ncbi:uncharacterized protein EI97DRAFT_366935, partial [Westerdykella ornata]
QALARLRAYKPPPTQWYNCPLSRRAAVLILLFPDRHGELKVVLTMRASTLRSYAGQAALPGGKADSLTETPFTIARREAYEEIGLPQDDDTLPPGFLIEHLCEMPTNMARTELGVRPCVAFLGPSTSYSNSENGNGNSTAAAVEEKMIPRLDPKEVAAVFTAPFHNFLKKNWESRGPGPLTKSGARHSWYRGSWQDWHESRWRMHNFYIPRPGVQEDARKTTPNSSTPQQVDSTTSRHHIPEGDDPSPSPLPFDSLTTFRVFGMTARILVDAARVAYGEEPEFEHNSHFGDEELIRRLIQMGRFSEKRVKGEELTAEVLRQAAKM